MSSKADVRLKALLGRFRKEDGAVTVAAVLWIPFFVIFLSMLADAALIFYGQARALQVAQDANRSYSVGKLTTEGEAEDYVEAALSKISPNASASTTHQDFLIRTVITIPASDLAAIGFFTSLTSFQMQVVAQMVKEF